MSLVNSLWRAVAVYRVAALAYAALLMANAFSGYRHAAAGWGVLGVMAAWTAAASIAYAKPERRTWLAVGADVVVGAACLYASRYVVGLDALSNGAATVPMAWIAAPVVSAALFRGRRAGAATALLMGLVDLAIRGGMSQVVLNETVLLILAGVVIAYAARLAIAAEERTQRAAEVEAAARERERLARNIHDSVLQVLAMVQRRGAELGGDAAELGRLAGEQESTLRTLIRPEPPSGHASVLDVRAELAKFEAPDVSLAVPATAVPLPRRHANELGAAVSAALDNVKRHCPAGTRVWLLVEDVTDAVRVTVRDNGPGFPDGRLAEAETDGRLGVAHSIHGRLRDVGGTATVQSRPGEGTEVELTLPRPRERA
jgi:signal transduction histidine kinase